jgi:hypothetical protein
MSTKRRILTALAVFAVAGSLLAVADAKKPPPKLAALDTPAQPNAPVRENAQPVKEKPHANNYLPVHHFGGY